MSPVILGIETSCDETAAAVVDSDGRIWSSVVSSQLDVHRAYGGVVPELASREHLRNIVPVVREAIESAGIPYDELAAVAVTAGPGLMGALLVGVMYAKGISFAAGIPLIGINHLEGHVHAVLLEARQQDQEIEFPALTLIVSGGHTHLYVSEDGQRYRLLGRTRDDAVGEAYDKVGVTLGFGYPGGPILDALSDFGKAEKGIFTVPLMKGNALDFSFSGYKTAALRWRDSHAEPGEVENRRALLASSRSPSIEEWCQLTPQRTLDMIAAFQKTVVDHLESNCLDALEMTGARSLIVSGGVACNRGLRARLQDPRFPVRSYFPKPVLSTDNAVMIAAAAFPKLARGETSGFDLEARSSLRLEEVISQTAR